MPRNKKTVRQPDVDVVSTLKYVHLVNMGAQMADVLVVAAHPDDEVLGIGGTVARHVRAGQVVTSFILGEGALSRVGASGDAVVELRQAATRAAAILGATPPRFGGMADNALDQLRLIDIIRPIEAVIAELKPRIIYTHHGGDLNVDHRLVHQAVMTSCRPIPGSTVRTLRVFETVSSTEWSNLAIGPTFRPDRFHDIHETLESKLKALEAYDSEMRPFPHARSREAVEALARLRGSQAGLLAAEAFVTIFDIETAA